MPTASDPRIVVRVSRADKAMLDAAAEAVGVSTSGLVREAALRAAREVAGDVSAGRVRLRRRSAAPVSESSSEVVAPVAAPVVPASGVERADFFRLIAQRRSR